MEAASMEFFPLRQADREVTLLASPGTRYPGPPKQKQNRNRNKAARHHCHYDLEVTDACSLQWRVHVMAARSEKINNRG